MEGSAQQMVLDYVQHLAPVGAMETSDTGTAFPCSHGYWVHVLIMNKHFSDLLAT